MNEISLPLVIRDGCFYRGNEKIRPEIGNIEQINLIKQQSNYIESIENGVQNIDYETDIIDITYKSEITFTCLCGHFITELSYEESCSDVDWMSSDNMFDNEIFVCPKCNREYIMRNNKLYMNTPE